MPAFMAEFTRSLLKKVSISSFRSAPPQSTGSTRNAQRGRQRITRARNAIAPIPEEKDGSNDSSSTASTVTVTAAPAPAPAPEPTRGRVINVLHRRERPGVQKEQLRELRELIRRRYTLDVEIWRQRHEPTQNRHLAEEQMIQSDATLKKIKKMVNKLDNRDNFSKEEYTKFQGIKRAIDEDGKRNWKKNPPWEDAKSELTENEIFQLSFVPKQK